MNTIVELNAALEAAGQAIVIKRHPGAGSFYIASTRWTNAPWARFEGGLSYDGDGHAILNSAMSLDWVRNWTADRLRDAARRTA